MRWRTSTSIASAEGCVTPLGKLKYVRELEDPKYILVQTDYEVWSILESIGMPERYCQYLLVVVGDAEYDEVWALDSVYLDSQAELIFCDGEVTA